MNGSHDTSQIDALEAKLANALRVSAQQRKSIAGERKARKAAEAQAESWRVATMEARRCIRYRDEVVLPDARARIEAAEAERDLLREALEPFEDLPGEGDEDYPDSTPITVLGGRSQYYGLKLGDFRRVRSALNGGKP